MRLENIDRFVPEMRTRTTSPRLARASPRVSHLTRLPRVALSTLSPLARASTAVDISPSTRRRVTSVAHACRSALE